MNGLNEMKEMDGEEREMYDENEEKRREEDEKELRMKHRSKVKEIETKKEKPTVEKMNVVKSSLSRSKEKMKLRTKQQLNQVQSEVSCKSIIVSSTSASTSSPAATSSSTSTIALDSSTASPPLSPTLSPSLASSERSSTSLESSDSVSPSASFSHRVHSCGSLEEILNLFASAVDSSNGNQLNGDQLALIFRLSRGKFASEFNHLHSNPRFQLWRETVLRDCPQFHIRTCRVLLRELSLSPYVEEQLISALIHRCTQIEMMTQEGEGQVEARVGVGGGVDDGNIKRVISICISKLLLSRISVEQILSDVEQYSRLMTAAQLTNVIKRIRDITNTNIATATQQSISTSSSIPSPTSIPTSTFTSTATSLSSPSSISSSISTSGSYTMSVSDIQSDPRFDMWRYQVRKRLSESDLESESESESASSFSYFNVGDCFCLIDSIYELNFPRCEVELFDAIANKLCSMEWKVGRKSTITLIQAYLHIQQLLNPNTNTQNNFNTSSPSSPSPSASSSLSASFRSVLSRALSVIGERVYFVNYVHFHLPLLLQVCSLLLEQKNQKENAYFSFVLRLIRYYNDITAIKQIDSQLLCNLIIVLTNAAKQYPSCYQSVCELLKSISAARFQLQLRSRAPSSTLLSLSSPISSSSNTSSINPLLAELSPHQIENIVSCYKTLGMRPPKLTFNHNYEPTPTSTSTSIATSTSPSTDTDTLSTPTPTSISKAKVKARAKVKAEAEAKAELKGYTKRQPSITSQQEQPQTHSYSHSHSLSPIDSILTSLPPYESSLEVQNETAPFLPAVTPVSSTPSIDAPTSASVASSLSTSSTSPSSSTSPLSSHDLRDLISSCTNPDALLEFVRVHSSHPIISSHLHRIAIKLQVMILDMEYRDNWKGKTNGNQNEKGKGKGKVEQEAEGERDGEGEAEAERVNEIDTSGVGKEDTSSLPFFSSTSSCSFALDSRYSLFLECLLSRPLSSYANNSLSRIISAISYLHFISLSQFNSYQQISASASSFPSSSSSIPFASHSPEALNQWAKNLRLEEEVFHYLIGSSHDVSTSASPSSLSVKASPASSRSFSEHEIDHIMNAWKYRMRVIQLQLPSLHTSESMSSPLLSSFSCSSCICLCLCLCLYLGCCSSCSFNK